MKTTLYPHIEPYTTGYIKVSSIHKLYFEEVGNKNGIPILFLHGGPGAGISPYYRRFFDPKAYRVILFDQRGSGKSKPNAELRENTTWDLVNDIELLRKKLNIEKWILFGGSWGSTLALCYAINYSKNILAMVLRGVYLCRKSELNWYYQMGASKFFPSEWENFIELIPINERGDLIRAYHKRMISGKSKNQLKFAKMWSKWEASTINLTISQKLIDSFSDPKFALAFARIETHYFSNNIFFNDDNYILNNIRHIKNIPTYIVHGRYDLPCPLENAWQLFKVLDNAKLYVVNNAGHSAFEKGIVKKLILVTETLKKLFNSYKNVMPVKPTRY